MKIEFHDAKYKQVVMVDHEDVGSVELHVFLIGGWRFVFTPGLNLENNFSPPQCAEIKKAVADKITILEVIRRLTK